MKSFNKVLSFLLALCIIIPCSAYASDGVSVDSSGSLVKNGAKLDGLYNEVYYKGGERETSLNGVKKIGNLEYCFRQGKSFTGVYGNRYYKNGVWCSLLNGNHSFDGKEYEFTNGEINQPSDAVSDGSGFTERVSLFSGAMCGFYYEDGHIDFNFTGYKTYLNDTYYVRAGKLYNGYFEKCFYKNGLADKGFNGIHSIDGTDYCFVAGYIYTGIYNNAYYVDGLKKDISGYKTIDNVRYYLDKGVLANGVFDGAFFKNGLVDVTVNGKVNIGDEVFTFINGITSDGLHDGKWYTDGRFDISAEGIKIYNGLPHFIKAGRVASGVCEYKGKLRYFERGELNSFTGWKYIEGDRYYINSGVALSGVAEINATSYLFDSKGRLCKEREAVFENVVYTADENGVAKLAPQIFIPQRDSEIPYPHAKHPNATISSSGCGVCSALMVIENSTTYTVALEDFTQLMLENGCRVSDGTNMDAAGEVLRKEYGFEFEKTTDIEKVKQHIKDGYLAVASVGRIPLFSFTGGHFVVITGMTDEQNAIIFDPNVREGKYGNGVRSDIHFNSENNEVYASFETIDKDANHGCYWLFTPTKNIALRHSSTTKENMVITE